MKYFMRPLVILIIIGCSEANFKEHYRYKRAENHQRWKRQFGGATPAQIDLNITVPFIFSARLYPYGPDRGDNALEPTALSQAFVLKHELSYFGRNYSVIHILRDGAIGFSSGLERVDRRVAFPRGPKALAVFWTPVSLGQTGRVYFRETEDRNVLNLARSEVQIQYRYGEDFRPRSVLIVTWENVAPPNARNDLPNSQRNLFQLALILSKNGSFAHMVYSKLKWNDDAVAGFSEGESGESHYSLPGSGTPEAILLANQSDIGIPGEWLFKLDEPQVHLCGPGFKGLECIDRCEQGNWYYDCVRDCHCDRDAPCNTANGFCPTPGCKDGWSNPPVCDIDIDECEEQGQEVLCPSVQPDCINTPGAYLCMCLAGYDEVSNICIGSEISPTANIDPGTQVTVRVVPFAPRVVTPRLILPHHLNIATGPPRLQTPFVQSVGFTAKVDTLGPDGPQATQAPPIEESIVPFTPRIIQPNFHTNRPQPIRPQVQTARPQPFRPQVQTARPQSSRPRIQTAPHPQIQTAARPAVQTTRVQSTGPQTFRPHIIQPEVIQPISATFVPPQSLPTNRTRYRVVSPTQAPLVPVSGCALRCGEHAQCQLNAGGIPICVCQQGWSGDGQFCVDINECFVENACEGNARCQNTLGGYNCICDEGFESDGHTCIDVDECQDPLLLCPGGDKAICINVYGSYECRCKEGYNGNPTSILGCIDINECLIPEFYCGANADCENSQGGFICHCHQGFVRSAEGNSCEDVDECIRGPCDKAAICYNTPGSFKCSCIDGYGGDGITCAETILFPFDRQDDMKLPRQPNSIVEVPLSRPVTVFGKQYSKAYVSANGVVSFDQPLVVYEDKPIEEMTMVGFSPLYLRNDPTLGGDVYFRETTDYGTLTRSSLNIQEDFNQPEFRATSVMVVTFDKVHAYGSSENEQNTYQMVLTSGDTGTYVTYIYDDISTRTAKAGILSSDPSMTVVLPGSATNSANLRLVSNIGEPGKWLFRVDQEQVVPCPAGMTGPPFCEQGCQPGLWGQNCAKICRCADGIPCDFSTGYCSNQRCQPGYKGDNCQEDIDECMTAGLNRCAETTAHCINTEGSYICQCAHGYTGDGYQCSEMDACLMKYGVPCDFNAVCLLDINLQPHCLCTEGFLGDGYRCTPVPETTTEVFVAPTTTERTTTSTARTQPTTTREETTTETTTITPIIFGFTTPRPKPTTRRPVIDNFVTAPPPPPVQRPSTPSTGPNDNGVNDIINNVITRGNSRNAGNYETADTSNMLVIIIPAVLCGIWLILIVVLLAVCLRRRKQRQRSKYGLGYYMPPSSSKDTLKRSSSAQPSAAAASSSAYYGSQWSIPRPTYDCYQQGTYYPNPYTPYKF